jgi:hypothetical protein
LKLSAILEPLIAAGVPGDVILATVRAFEEQREDALERRRESDRNRQTAKRSRESRDTSTVTRDSSLVRERDTRVEDISSNLEISGKQEEKKTRAAVPRGDLADFKSELSSILDPERVEAIVAVRRKKGATMTANTGRLLVTAIRKCPLSPAEVADEMALRNWTSVKPEWLERTQRPSTGPPPYSGPPRTVGELAIHRLQTGNFRDEPTSHSNGYLDASEPRGPDEGSRGAKLIALATAAVSRGG